MSEPLINRDAMIRELYWEESSGPVPKNVVEEAESVIAYLRSVLTPEALVPTDFVGNTPRRREGGDLHRRIFGEDE